MKSLLTLEELLFPIRCIGCSALGCDICLTCRRHWRPHIYKKWSLEIPHFPIYSAISYSPFAGKVILAAKEDGIIRAEKLIVDSILYALKICIQEVGPGVLIPIPSRKSVARKRGRQFINDVVAHISESVDVEYDFNLAHVRKVRDQSSLDAHQRAINIHGALISQKYLKRKVILIDDLVTTGSTLNEAARALRANGIEVAAAVTACVAEPLR